MHCIAKTLLSALSHEFSDPMLKDVDGDNDDDDMGFILHLFIKLAMIIINYYSKIMSNFIIVDVAWP